MAVRMDAGQGWLNYHHLYYFYVIAKSGGIAPAAATLKLSQPALSTQLKRLEEALGRALFTRERKRLRLTEAGKVAYQYAEDVFRLGAEMVDALGDRLPGERVRLQIGALDGVPKDALLELLQTASRWGDLRVSVVEGRSPELLRELLAHQLDVIVADQPLHSEGAPHVRARRVARWPVSVYGSAKQARLRRGFPESLRGSAFVLPTRHSRLRHDLDHWFATRSLPIDVLAECEDTGLQCLFGMGVSALVPLSEPSARGLVREKKLVRIGRLDGVYEEIFLIATARKIENPIAAKLLSEFNL